MPNRKRIHTKSTERQTPRHLRKLRQTRLQVAAEAARIIATEGQHNYHAAKRKAADRIGVSERLALPSNLEVKQALKDYQSLYGGPGHDRNILQLRTAAVEVMQLLEAFRPRLVGSVLDGTADAHSRVSLHVFTESTEDVVLFFLERGMSFREEQRQIRWHDGSHRSLPLFVFDWCEATIELCVFGLVDLRQSPPSPIHGKPQKRATLAEVEMLLMELERGGDPLPRVASLDEA
jgi:hypothetical protein